MSEPAAKLTVVKNDSQLEAELAEIARRCERAVVTAYTELRRAGTDDFSAFASCTTLYRIHHPESSLSEARMLVAEWIDHHVVRKSDGETPGCPGA